MTPSPRPAEPVSYRFENAHLFPVERRLLVAGQPVTIGARAFDVLLALVERRERLVTRDELLDICWPESTVEPNNLAVQIGALRRTVGRHVIASVPARGYRFSAVVDVQPVGPVTPVGILGHRTNLPELEPLIGRVDDLRIVSELVDAHRLVTLLGAGGIGKTRLAQQVLDTRRNAYRHGVCFVELGSVGDATSLPGTIAAALGIKLGSTAAAGALEAAIAPLEILIALDNAEHLLEAISRLVDAIGQAAPAVRVLVTSQAPLRLPQEHLYRLGPLAMPAGRVGVEEALRYGAVETFVRRARAADHRFELSDRNLLAVVGLCKRLDGLPLAIELAAARLPLLGIEQIAESMDQRLQVLNGGFRHAPARQRTMAAMLEWSHHLLTANERIVYRRLAVLAGSGSFELVLAIATDVDHPTPDADGPLDGAAVVDALAALVDRSLVTVVVSREAPLTRRYRLLEMSRAHAAEQLVASGEIGLLEERHARAVAALLAQAWVDRWSGTIGYRAWIDRVEADRPNARAAYLWAKRHEAVDLVLSMAPVLLNRTLPGVGYEERRDIADLLHRWLATLPAQANQLPARTALMRFWNDHDVRRSLQEAEAALALAEASGDRFGAYLARAWQVRVLVQTRELDAARAALDKVDALEDPAWPAMRLWMGAEARATFWHVKGPPETYIEVVRRELAIVRLAGDAAHVTAGNLVDAQLLAGRPAEAVALGRQLVDELLDSRNELALLIARINLAAASLALGNLADARPVLEAAWRTARNFALHGDCADYLALIAAREQRWPAAAALAGYADAVYARRQAQRWPNETRAHEEAVRLTRAALGDAEFARLTADGARMADVQVSTLAFASG